MNVNYEQYTVYKEHSVYKTTIMFDSAYELKQMSNLVENKSDNKSSARDLAGTEYQIQHIAKINKYFELIDHQLKKIKQYENMYITCTTINECKCFKQDIINTTSNTSSLFREAKIYFNNYADSYYLLRLNDIIADGYRIIERVYYDVKNRETRELLSCGIDPSKTKRLIENEQAQYVIEEYLMQPGAKLDELVADIESRHTKVMTFEKNILELKELFEEFNILINLQQDSVNNIEQKIKITESRVDDAEQKLKTAEHYNKKKIKKTCCLLILIIIILCVIIIPSLGFTGNI